MTTRETDPGLDAATQRVMDELRRHASDTVREGPVFTIRCLCGKRFGFSASYESHVAEAVARAAREDVADTVREARAEAPEVESGGPI